MLPIQVSTRVRIWAAVLAILLLTGSARAGDPFAIQNNLQDLDLESEGIRSVPGAVRVPRCSDGQAGVDVEELESFDRDGDAASG